MKSSGTSAELSGYVSQDLCPLSTDYLVSCSSPRETFLVVQVINTGMVLRPHAKQLLMLSSYERGEKTQNEATFRRLSRALDC